MSICKLFSLFCCYGGLSWLVDQCIFYPWHYKLPQTEGLLQHKCVILHSRKSKSDSSLTKLKPLCQRDSISPGGSFPVWRHPASLGPCSLPLSSKPETMHVSDVASIDTSVSDYSQKGSAVSRICVTHWAHTDNPRSSPYVKFHICNHILKVPFAIWQRSPRFQEWGCWPSLGTIISLPQLISVGVRKLTRIQTHNTIRNGSNHWDRFKKVTGDYYIISPTHGHRVAWLGTPYIDTVAWRVRREKGRTENTSFMCHMRWVNAGEMREDCRSGYARDVPSEQASPVGEAWSEPKVRDDDEENVCSTAKLKVRLTHEFKPTFLIKLVHLATKEKETSTQDNTNI